MIYIESAKKSIKSLKKKYPTAKIIDVTSKGLEPWLKLSPFYPHKDIPIPFSPGYFSASVEGIWQGLKVFENSDIDSSKFLIQNMKGIKRTTRKYGRTLGHKNGINGSSLLNYIDARNKIYLPTYAWVLENKVQEVIKQLKLEAEKNDIVLLDFDINEDIQNTSKPLSHASLVKKYLEKKYPHILSLRFGDVIDLDRKKQKRVRGSRDSNNNNSIDNQLSFF